MATGTRAPSATGKTGTGATATKTPAAPKASKYGPCKCLHGTNKKCDGETTKVFARGHDARMASRLAKEVAAGKMTAAEAAKLIREAGGGDLLVSKMQHSADLRIEKNAAPATPKAPRKPAAGKAAAAKDEPATPAATGSTVGQPVPVMHGTKTMKAVVVRTADEKLVARHRFQGQNCDHPLGDD
jgi:hypothetical protein